MESQALSMIDKEDGERMAWTHDGDNDDSDDNDSGGDNGLDSDDSASSLWARLSSLFSRRPDAIIVTSDDAERETSEIINALQAAEDAAEELEEREEEQERRDELKSENEWLRYREES